LIHKQDKFGITLFADSANRPNVGMDLFRPSQATPITNFFLAGSYTQQDYIDSMEGATLSGRQAAKAILATVEQPTPVATV
jgi:zeta-carotene desaturase